MSAVIVRNVDNPLLRMVRPRSGGIRVGEALAAASANLAQLEAQCVTALDERLEALARFAREHPAVRPPPASLDQLISDAESALTVCGGVGRPLLAKALILLSAMADTLKHTDYWPVGALTPAINLACLFRNADVSDSEGEALLKQLGLCLDQYVRRAVLPAGDAMAAGTP